MKTRKLIRRNLQKIFWSFERPIEFFEEGSFVVDEDIETRRLNILLRLVREHNLPPSLDRAKAVDFACFVTHDFAGADEYAYRLYLAIKDKFSSNLNYNKLLARREILKYEKEFELPLRKPFERKGIDSEGYDSQKIELRMLRYIQSLEGEEQAEAKEFRIINYNKLHGLW